MLAVCATSSPTTHRGPESPTRPLRNSVPERVELAFPAMATANGRSVCSTRIVPACYASTSGSRRTLVQIAAGEQLAAFFQSAVRRL